jgi:hypothetical protein
MDDGELVTAHYEACWRQSKGRYNRWIEGRLHPSARRFYIVVAATEFCLMSGLPSLLEETRFTLAETADAYDAFGLDAHARAVRELRAVVNDETLSRDPGERDQQLLNDVEMPTAEIDRLNRLFPMAQAATADVYQRLAAFVRQHPEVFPAAAST